MKKQRVLFTILASTLLLLLGTALSSCCSRSADNQQCKIAAEEGTTQPTIKSCVLPEEYASATADEKQLINWIDASKTAMDLMVRDNEAMKLAAYITISKGADILFANTIIIGPEEDMSSDDSDLIKGQCEVPDGKSAFANVQQILRDMGGQEGLNLRIQRKSGALYFVW